ncbi:unnamed protein product, partial [Polarella glacialis]
AELPAGTVLAPRPDWWKVSAPCWTDSVLCSVVPTQPLVGAVRCLVADSLSDVQMASGRPGRLRGKDAVPPLPEPASVAESRPANRSFQEVKKRELPAEVQRGVEEEEEQVPSFTPPAKRRRRQSAISDLLRLDSAWTDSMLRSVALLAANVPSGA